MNAQQQITLSIPDVNLELSNVRLYALKLIYLLTFIGLGVSAWPRLIHPGKPWDPLYGVAFSFWAAYGLLMLLGLRLPIRMLPLMLLQFLYKLIWLAGVGYPLWAAGHLSHNASGLLKISTLGVLVDLAVIPWPYVFENILKPAFTREWRES